MRGFYYTFMLKLMNKNNVEVENTKTIRDDIRHHLMHLAEIVNMCCKVKQLYCELTNFDLEI